MFIHNKCSWKSHISSTVTFLSEAQDILKSKFSCCSLPFPYVTYSVGVGHDASCMSIRTPGIDLRSIHHFYAPSATTDALHQSLKTFFLFQGENQGASQLLHVVFVS